MSPQEALYKVLQRIGRFLRSLWPAFVRRLTGLLMSSQPPTATMTAGGSGRSYRGPGMDSAVSQIRILRLDDGEHQESTVYRLKKGWVVQFRLGPSLLGRSVNLYTNHPADQDDEFAREKYRKLEWKSDSNAADDTAIYAEVTVFRPGSFHYYFSYIESSSNDMEPRGSGYLLVDPVLTYGLDDEVLPLDCVQCQTVLTKSLGLLDDWMGRLKVSRETGYNMIHFTPIQKLGDSNSSYSISDQLSLMASASSKGGPARTLDDVQVITATLRDEWKVLSLSDIVLNHTANESSWLHAHPECAYNLLNSPHLRPAYLLDRAVHHFSVKIGQGEWESSGIPSRINEEKHLQAVHAALHGFVLPQAKIHEFFTVDVDTLVEEFHQLASATIPHPESSVGVDNQNTSKLRILQDPQFRRRGSSVDMDLALRMFNVKRGRCVSEDVRLTTACGEFRRCLETLNSEVAWTIQEHLTAAIDNVVSGARYERLACDGPKHEAVTRKHPLTTQYFTHPGKDLPLAEEEAEMYGKGASLFMAHNGWVMGDDPLKNFAESGSNVYLRRELIAWGDSVKLRYGDGPDDSPYLWQHMKKYSEQTARVFHGIRLDNCHSTPLHVAEYMLDAARKVRPDLLVVAELFTNSDQKDNIFVNRLGINSLIREAMSAGDSHEEGRLVYRYGGEPVGAFMQPHIRPLTPSIAHAMFLDQTHDNPSPVRRRSVFDLLPSAALVSMACCASGSNRGYDELVPDHIHVVKEERLYASWGGAGPNDVTLDAGIIAGKRALNKLHFELGMKGFSQVFVDQVTEDIVTVTRHDPVTHESVVLVAHTAFKSPSELRLQSSPRPLRVQGVIQEVILEAKLVPKSNKPIEMEGFTPSLDVISGLGQYQLELREHFPLEKSRALACRQEDCNGDWVVLDYRDFPPGSVVAVRVTLTQAASSAVNRLRAVISGLGSFPDNSELNDVISRLTLADLNRVLYRCDAEERDEGRGGGAYDIPRLGPLVYCGLQGFMSLLSDVRLRNDLGHPLCDNLRQGDWLMDYTSARLKLEESTRRLGTWLDSVFNHLRLVPRYLIPAYFDGVILGVYVHLLNQLWGQMSSFVKDGSEFTKALSLGSVQFGGVVKSAPLPELSHNLALPKPPTRGESNQQSCVTLSAGLPHFSTGYMRNWGRDTFISLRGLFLIPGRYQEARYMILAYAGCLRHGLIPNLLDGGKRARYNCRDATWWWLQCIQDYCTLVPGGELLLRDAVARIYPTDDSQPLNSGAKEQPLFDVIQEALNRHFQGTSFRERNAGVDIDRDMSDEGFKNSIGVDRETGFVFGGNVHNCGTWMDKMGSSEKAGNKGKPATPRDGSAVELVGLCRSAVAWLDRMNRKGFYPYSGVECTDDKGQKIQWTFASWASLIDSNFERHFYISDVPVPELEPKLELINRRAIYKDSHLASQFWADYQLRCNFPIALALAPEMVDPEHAWAALDTAEKLLLGPLGMRTLDPEDWAYRGDYDNGNDSDDQAIARGFNYHQGPEWLWPVGFFLRARLAIAPLKGGPRLLDRTISRVKQIMGSHYKHMQSSVWRSLPELTNKAGTHCRDSCPAQAWSMGCMLEVLYDLNQLETSYADQLSSANQPTLVPNST